MPQRKPIRRHALRLHLFVASGQYDYRGRQICARDDCGSTADASVHGVPERSEHEREVAARIVGERDA